MKRFVPSTGPANPAMPQTAEGRGCRVVLSIGPSKAVIPRKNHTFRIFKKDDGKCVLETRSRQGDANEFYTAATPMELAENTANVRVELARAGVTVTVVAPVGEEFHCNMGGLDELCRPMNVHEVGIFLEKFIAAGLAAKD